MEENKHKIQYSEKAKKVLLGFLGLYMCYFGGIGSCHYTMANYYYSKKEYDNCYYHARETGKYLSFYKGESDKHILNTMIKTASYNYETPKDYYAFYQHTSPRIPLRVMHIEDTHLMKKLDMGYKYHLGDGSKGRVIKIHRYKGELANYNDKYIHDRNHILHTDPITDIEYPQIIRRFVHIYGVNCHLLPLQLHLYHEQNKAAKKHEIKLIKNYTTAILNEFIPIQKENDHLLHLEYGLICTNILWEFNTYKINDIKVKNYIPKTSQKIYNTVKTIKEKLLIPKVKEYKDLTQGINFMQEVVKKYENN